MHKFGVQLALEELRDSRKEWLARRREFQEGYDRVLARLLHEAAYAYMSPAEVADALGVDRVTVRRAMREAGLDPAKGRRMLSNLAAKALTENAEIMGVNPTEFDLTSPLAYLPMGSELKAKYLDVKELNEDEA